MLNKKSGRKEADRYFFLSKEMKCKLYHSLLMGFPIVESWKENRNSFYECTYCGRIWKGKEGENTKLKYRLFRG